MYKYVTTFWTDFDIAEKFGSKAIKDTAARAFEEWKNDIVYLTELVMVINHKCWDYYFKNKDELSQIYSNLYYEYYDKAIDFLEKKNNKEELNYFFRTLD